MAHWASGSGFLHTSILWNPLLLSDNLSGIPSMHGYAPEIHLLSFRQWIRLVHKVQHMVWITDTGLAEWGDHPNREDIHS